MASDSGLRQDGWAGLHMEDLRHRRESRIGEKHSKRQETQRAAELTVAQSVIQRRLKDCLQPDDESSQKYQAHSNPYTREGENKDAQKPPRDMKHGL